MERWLGMGLIGLVLLIGACGGDNDNGADELSLNEYFSRLQALSDEVRSRADGLAEPVSFDDDVAGVFNQSLDIFRDFLNDVRELNPPSEAQSAHEALVSALDHFIDANEDLVGQLEDASTEAESQAIFENVPAEVEGTPIGSACADLQQIATDNNISVNLDCGSDNE